MPFTLQISLNPAELEPNSGMLTENKNEVSEFYTNCTVISTSITLPLEMETLSAIIGKGKMADLASQAT